MSTLFLVSIAFDDDSPAEQAPFSHEPSVWSLFEDYRLCENGDNRLFAALGYDRDGTFPKTLYSLRGFPDFVAGASGVRQHLDGREYVTWLTLPEIYAALTRAGLALSDTPGSFQILIDIMRHLATFVSDTRVAAIFAFVP